MLRTFCGTEDTSPKSNLTKAKRFTARHKRISLASGNESAYGGPEGRGSNPYLRFGRVESAGISQTPRLAASASRASWAIYAKNACDWPMKRPMAVRNRSAPMAAP
jgi:hypothetical protein